jgi:hypothetical protein
MISKFDFPARVADLTSAQARTAWSTQLHQWFTDVEGNLPANARFFNLLDRQIPDSPPAVIPWNGFPRKYALFVPENLERRWQLAERVETQDLFGRQAPFSLTPNTFTPAGLRFRDQDEYCEWRTVTRNGAVERVIFTCENPEYWEFLASQDEDLLLGLYRDLVSPDVTLPDLLFQTDVFRATRNGPENLRGRYNPLNRFNTVDGIVHLTHPANSLQAELVLAGDGTVLRRNDAGQPVIDDAALICCAQYGDPNRASDPTIGGRVNALVRSGLAVTLDDPVGLYISGIDLAGVETPDSTPELWFRPLRPTTPQGPRPMILRAEFAPPEGSGLSMADVTVGGEPLRFGGQLAELLTMVIYGRGIAEQTPAPAADCEGKCCRIPQAPALVRPVAAGTVCPPVETAPVLGLEEADVQQITLAEPAALTAQGLPQVGRR